MLGFDGPSDFLYILAALGALVPFAALLLYFDLSRRIKRLPAATRLENAWDKLECALEERAELEGKIEEMGKYLFKLEQAQQLADEKQAELEQARQDLANLEPQLKEKRELEEEVLKIQENLATLTDQAEQRKSEAEVAQKAQKDAEEKKADAAKELEKIELACKEAEKNRTKLENAIEKIKAEHEPLKQQLEEKIAHLQKQKSVLDAQVAGKKQDLKSANQRHEEIRKETNETKEQQAEERGRLAALEKQAGSLERRTEEAKGWNAEQAEIRKKEEKTATERLSELTSPPACLADSGLKKARGAPKEIDALNQLEEYIAATGLRFPQRIIYAFHTCLKTASISPLTVLAGISGTGKSELPRRYAEGMGFHFLPIPVQPRWDGPQDLLGFYNYLEQRYKATDLAKALVHMDQYNWAKQSEPYKDRMLMVLLDEMNLARVEYYFSNFLSSLEVRRSIDPQNDSDRIAAETELEIGPANLLEEFSNRLYVGGNVFFVGTMNEDETTQALSDKVIDRSNVLRFPRPTSLAATEPRPASPPNSFLEESTWKIWQKDELSEKGDLAEWIEELNKALDGLRRPFGHRVNQAILSYAENYPEPDAVIRIQRAFADQLEQRILPKLRGIEVEDHNDEMDKIEDLIKKTEDEALLKAFRRDREDAENTGQFFWKGVSREEDPGN